MSILSSASATDLNEPNQWFIYSQLFNENLLKMEQEGQAKQEFVELCRVSNMLTIIQNLEWWSMNSNVMMIGHGPSNETLGITYLVNTQ